MDGADVVLEPEAATNLKETTTSQSESSSSIKKVEGKPIAEPPLSSPFKI